MWVVGPTSENDFLNLDEVVTVDKRGPAATTVSGEISSYLGIPIVVSEASREDLTGGGIYDGVTTTKSNVILWNYERFRLGSKRGFTVETDRDITKQMNIVVASMRKAFQPIETPSATITSVSMGYNFNA